MYPEMTWRTKGWRRAIPNRSQVRTLTAISIPYSAEDEVGPLFDKIRNREKRTRAIASLFEDDSQTLQAVDRFLENYETGNVSSRALEDWGRFATIEWKLRCLARETPYFWHRYDPYAFYLRGHLESYNWSARTIVDVPIAAVHTFWQDLRKHLSLEPKKNQFIWRKLVSNANHAKSELQRIQDFFGEQQNIESSLPKLNALAFAVWQKRVPATGNSSISYSEAIAVDPSLPEKIIREHVENLDRLLLLYELYYDILPCDIGFSSPPSKINAKTARIVADSEANPQNVEKVFESCTDSFCVWSSAPVSYNLPDDIKAIERLLLQVEWDLYADTQMISVRGTPVRVHVDGKQYDHFQLRVLCILGALLQNRWRRVPLEQLYRAGWLWDFPEPNVKRGEDQMMADVKVPISILRQLKGRVPGLVIPDGNKNIGYGIIGSFSFCVILPRGRRITHPELLGPAQVTLAKSATG
jgi:hypothetical protein